MTEIECRAACQWNKDSRCIRDKIEIVEDICFDGHVNPRDGWQGHTDVAHCLMFYPQSLQPKASDE